MFRALLAPPTLHSLHPSHRQALASALLTLLGMTTIFVLARLIPQPIWLEGSAHYLPLHMALETAAVIIASLVFVVGWKTYRQRNSRGLLTLACLFLGVAILDFSHMVSYDGMPEFVTPADPEKAIAFWLAARSLAAVALLWVAVSPWEAPLRRGHGMILLGTVLGVVLAVHLVVLLFPAKLPRTFLPGIGLTAFKIFYEYGLIALNLLAALAFWRSMKTAQPFNTAALFGAVGAMALSELCFTLYSSVTDQMNLLGHIYKNISYAFLFRAIFVEAVETPKALLQAANRRLQATFEAIPDLLVEVNPDGLLTGYHASRHTDYRVDPKWVVGKQLEDFLPAPVAASCRDTLASASQSGAAQSQPFALTIRGVEYWLQLSIARKPGSGQEGFVAIVRDVSEARHQEAQILQLALYDPLTGLPNRRLFAERIDAALASSERHGKTLALLYLDLDHFKNVNDTLGHQAGDMLLQAVAERLRNALREEDVLSRQGGDEFVLYLPAIDAAGAAHVAQRLLDVLSDPVRFGEHDCTPAASIGIAVYPNDGMNFEELSRRADAAMYQAKQQGRSTYRFFTPAIQERMSRMLLLETALRTAIANQELSLHFQPQWEIADQRLCGTEVLLRWNHPRLGQISPAEFIPVAEASGQIIALGDWVLRNALASLREWLNEGLAPVVTAVNISAAQFRQPHLADRIGQLLTEFNISPSLLELELTEGVAMEDPLGAARQIQHLRSLGVRIAIDDFGTGYSSLTQLTRFRPNTLKLDRSFVHSLGHDAEALIIVRSMISLAQSLGIETLAEGVETEEQLSLLREHGCHYLQGYLWGMPLEASGMRSLLLDQTPTRPVYC
ncbi:bifunctional diguanylate cyclase/phosphodiesterase [Pseudomonas sp.]|uniref:bifunctional diguanylate cyclase/phosphodiesterase n=1 Tax=Pseudomonas sp. TaxID=306 RepID=UPI0027298677|nr:EAL domain-containing protein [Pseudomonas sp.]